MYNNSEASVDHQKGDKKGDNKQIMKESSNSQTKNRENSQNETSVKLNTRGKQTKEDEDLIEQDLSDEEDNYEEPSVQKYMPGVYVDLKLKTKLLEKGGNKIAIPMIVDFYSECVKKYGDEKNFIYEESYLESTRVKTEELYPELYKFPKAAGDLNGDHQSQLSLDNKQVIGFPESQKQGPIEENLDDVIWLKNRPNDPLLRCIRSITDRLNIQGIVGDPTSYLKKGGDDMHYDMDDPFFDDSAMLSELKMSKSDILLQRAMEREFSDWSEDEEEMDSTNVEPEDFVSEYYREFEKHERKRDKSEGEHKLFFDPTGWREYHSKIPKQFITIFNEFENTSKKITEPITEKILRLKIKELLESIFKKLNKMQELNRVGTKKKQKKTKQNEVGENEVDNKEETREESESKLQESVAREESDKSLKTKVSGGEDFSEGIKRRGLNCMLPYRVVDVNGKILRWIVKSITATTNACSPYEIHCEWFTIVVANNERLVNEYSGKLKGKLTAKLQAMKPKKLEIMISLLSESTKSLSKSTGIIKKLLKEHRDLNGHKSTKSSSKEGAEAAQKKSLIEISLDSNREDHEEFMGLDPGSKTPEVKEPESQNAEMIDVEAQEVGTPKAVFHKEEVTKANGPKTEVTKDVTKAGTKDAVKAGVAKAEARKPKSKKQQVSQVEIPQLELEELEYITPHTPGFLIASGRIHRSYTPTRMMDEPEEVNDSCLDEKTDKSGHGKKSKTKEPETNSGSPAAENEVTSRPKTRSRRNSKANKEHMNVNEKSEETVEVGEGSQGVDVKESKGEKETINESESQTIKTPKKVNSQSTVTTVTTATTKEEDLETILKQSKIMNRVKDVHKVFKVAGSEVIAFIQVSNLAISVANKLQTKQFKHVIEHLGLTNNPFEQTYKKVSELMSIVLQELYEVKVNIPIEVAKVVVIKLQNELKVEDLYEKKNKKPLLLFDNSHTKAAPGVVILEGPKQKSTKKGAQTEGPEGPKSLGAEGAGKTKEVKGSPKRKAAVLNSLAKMQNTKANGK
ncbi:conserved hypothetical protein [Theileria orientalis strain Shintoku]|uniref:Hpc2-related domain-containing protein n=1 Tax=Theileria orientalis strain Shintoku TaxID=869250 RepID=J4DNZ6_THEOR|nr:conserved hypothetical protein [Theileria orientalis strain Shintoku]BAM39824.1 conserved hypothetical protein [Theileria orientalis strain Shintoku]|eukprot:XP_009690125.1 conserved hypothetical protein [Theileria orientalis strain Shintoku]